MPRTAPRRSQKRALSALPAVAYTLAPQAAASWIAVVPMPLVPPWTRTVSPALHPPRSNRLVHTVKNVSPGTAAASTRVIFLGIGRHSGAAATAYSA